MPKHIVSNKGFALPEMLFTIAFAIAGGIIISSLSGPIGTKEQAHAVELLMLRRIGIIALAAAVLCLQYWLGGKAVLSARARRARLRTHPRLPRPTDIQF
jgi:hypothetical protein